MHKTTPLKVWSVFAPSGRLLAAKPAGITTPEAETDRLISTLYGLTAPETAIVEGNSI